MDFIYFLNGTFLKFILNAWKKVQPNTTLNQKPRLLKLKVKAVVGSLSN